MTASSAAMPIVAWLDELASDAPAPGGGAAAALCGALGAALTSMVARFTVNRPKYAAVQDDIVQALSESEAARARLVALVDSDAAAYQAVVAAYRLPRGDADAQATRESAIQAALLQATEVPLQVAEAARAVVAIARVVATIGNRTVLTDAVGAALLAQAAIAAALLYVDINLAALKDQEQRARFITRRQALSVDVDAVVASLQAMIARS